MNKKTKGLVTAALGASMLLGSAGTFALWWDQATIDDDGLITGTLAAEDAELSDFIRTESWSNLATDVTVDYLVPGDVAVADITNGFLTLVGESIRAELTIDGLDDAIGRAPVIVTLTGGGQTIELINYDETYAAWSAVFSAAEVDLFNAAIEAGNYPTLTIEFPPFTDGTRVAQADRSNFWGQPGEEGIDGGRLAEIVLRDNVQLIFVQTHLASSLESLVP